MDIPGWSIKELALGVPVGHARSSQAGSAASGGWGWFVAGHPVGHPRSTNGTAALAVPLPASRLGVVAAPIGLDICSGSCWISRDAVAVAVMGLQWDLLLDQWHCQLMGLMLSPVLGLACGRVSIWIASVDRWEGCFGSAIGNGSPWGSMQWDLIGPVVPPVDEAGGWAGLLQTYWISEGY